MSYARRAAGCGLNRLADLVRSRPGLRRMALACLRAAPWFDRWQRTLRHQFLTGAAGGLPITASRLHRHSRRGKVAAGRIPHRRDLADLNATAGRLYLQMLRARTGRQG
ncbi:MAG: hypothetical protein B7Z76_02885 [Acidiphilium sp. 20-67-58]|nr:MAG: hypothetical protein B7Z76_02885 [Acidiphilium sp. 20-67-58]